MTREEEIWNAINNLQIGDYNEDDSSDNDEYDGNDLQNAFCTGAKWADKNQKNPWIKWNDKKPEEGIEVIAYNKNWIDEDFNPNGTRIGFINGDGEFTSAYWWDYQDCYTTINSSLCLEDKVFYSNHINNTEPEMWMYIPNH